jgi:hypothetical protein
MALTPEQAIDKAQGIAQSGVIELIRAREVKIINTLVSAYHSGKMTERDAAIGIATIAALRMILSDMDREVRQGVAAGHALMEQR